MDKHIDALLELRLGCRFDSEWSQQAEEQVAAIDAAIALMRAPVGDGHVAEVYAGAFGIHYIGCADPNKLPVGTKLYTHPQDASGNEVVAWQRRLRRHGASEWTPWRDCSEYDYNFYRANNSNAMGEAETRTLVVGVAMQQTTKEGGE